jgi:hypothetical protein
LRLIHWRFVGLASAALKLFSQVACCLSSIPFWGHLEKEVIGLRASHGVNLGRRKVANVGGKFWFGGNHERMRADRTTLTFVAELMSKPKMSGIQSAR